MSKSIKERFWEKVDIQEPEDCWLWLASLAGRSYGHIWFDGRIEYAHRVAWIITYGPIPPKICVCHHCDVSLCVNPKHLFLGTHKDNMRDMISKGRQIDAPMPGERNGRAILTEEKVIRAKELKRQGETYKSIAESMGVTISTIHKVVKGITWKHLGE